MLSLDQINDPTGLGLYTLVTTQIFHGEKYAFLQKNLIGVCTDRGSNMFSTRDAGLSNRLQREFGHVVIATDISHNFNLICNSALKKFPAEPLSLIRKICSHFSRSSYKRGDGHPEKIF